MHISVNSVHAAFLQLISLDFVHQADAATLLVHIDEYALAFFLDHLHCQVELLATLATHRTEYVASCT